MGKQSKTKPSSGTRTRTNPLTGEVEIVSGTKAGKKRSRLPEGHPLRTHQVIDKRRTQPIVDDDD